MKVWERSCHISRIVSGQTKIRINNEIFYVRSASRPQQCMADELFMEYLQESEDAGAYSEEEFQNFLEENLIWISGDESRLKVLYEDLDKLKVGLFETRFRSVEHSKIRKRIPICKAEIHRAEILKHSYDHISAIGMANTVKQRYLLGCSVFTDEGPYWSERSGWESPDPFLDKIMFKLNKLRLGETDFRELARNEPWRGTWNLQKHCGGQMFDCSALDLTDEQKSLMIWSSIYDSIREHPDNLQEEIVEDDDMVDGWMIIKRKDRDKNHVKNPEDMFTSNDKIKNSQEFFVKVDTPKDAQRVMSFNTEEASRIAQERLSIVKERGEVKEQDLPDSITRIKQQRMDKLSQHIKQGK